MTKKLFLCRSPKIVQYICFYFKLLKGNRRISPPDIIKQAVVKKYARKFSIDILIETGTYKGSMLEAVKNVFKEIYSIELDNKLYIKAKKRFAKYANIYLIQGDSAKILPDILSSIKKRSLFWLDAHYSGGITAKGSKLTPTMEELKHIFNHSVKDHVILIDDARIFTGKNNYPSLEEIKRFVLKNRPNWLFKVKNDIIRIHKKPLKN